MACIYTRRFIDVDTCMHTYTYIDTYMHTSTYTYVNTYADLYTYMHIYLYIYTYACIYIYVYAYVYIYIYMCICTHACIRLALGQGRVRSWPMSHFLFFDYPLAPTVDRGVQRTHTPMSGEA